MGVIDNWNVDMRRKKEMTDTKVQAASNEQIKEWKERDHDPGWTDGPHCEVIIDALIARIEQEQDMLTSFSEHHDAEVADLTVRVLELETHKENWTKNGEAWEATADHFQKENVTLRSTLRLCKGALEEIASIVNPPFAPMGHEAHIFKLARRAVAYINAWDNSSETPTPGVVGTPCTCGYRGEEDHNCPPAEEETYSETERGRW